MKIPTKKEIREWRKQGKKEGIIIRPGDRVQADPEYFLCVNPVKDIHEDDNRVIGTVYRPWEKRKKKHATKRK